MRKLILDLLALVGLGLFLWGVRQIYPPAAFILGGLILTAVAVLGAATRSAE